jgi:hypothetical protein
MTSDIRRRRPAFNAAAIVMFVAGALQGCTSRPYGASEARDDDDGPEMDDKRSSEVPSKTKAPGALPDTIDFGSVDCNAQVPARTFLLPTVTTGSTPWWAGVEGDEFEASPVKGTLVPGGEPARISVLPTTSAVNLTLAPVEKKLTISTDGLSRVVSLKMQPRGAIVSFASPTLDLGKTAGAAPTKITSVTNKGNAAITIDLVSTNAAFLIAPRTLVLEPKMNASITVTLTRIGAFTGSAFVSPKGGPLCGVALLNFSGERL